MVATAGTATHVWVRTDLVHAICRNDGSLPKGWRPRKRLRDERDAWGWCRALVVNEQQRSSSPQKLTPSNSSTTNNNNNSPFGQGTLRKTRWRSAAENSTPNKNNALDTPKTLAVTLTVDDSSVPDLDQTTVRFSYNTGDNSKVCAANTWWLEGHDPTDDLTLLEQLHEPAVVYCLQKRYELDLIYTYTGKILLALNPFQSLDLYGPKVMEQYASPHPSAKRPPPHIYAIAQDAYRSMLDANENQSILVSGESGAGKTVTTKIIMQYLATLSSQHHASGIESQVLQSNPVLESFGNARTVRNDNSSRFGKFIQIHFSPSGRLLSATIQTYLLEKVRLITQGENERNYHVFYELLAGLSQMERRQLYIGSYRAQDFCMTAAGTYDRRDGVDDRATFRELQHALQTVGFGPAEQTDLFAVCCALLHTSNLTFTETRTSSDDACKLDRTNSSLAAAVSLWGVQEQDLENALTRCAIQARGEVLYKQLDRVRAQKALEALMKTTYAALFDSIVRRVNGYIAAGQIPSSSAQQIIGVLDIFGFESFAVNSLEQLCINYCNEALQQQFNRFVFKLEQQEYQKEGIEWSFISFPDNQDVLDLIETKHDGILSILDEQSRLPRCTDGTFALAVYDKCSNHARLHVSKAQQACQQFAIEHYAGLVEYDTAGFLEKNKDELPKEATELLQSSAHPFFAQLGHDLSAGAAITQKASSAPAKRKAMFVRSSSSLIRDSVGTQFRSQLAELRRRIETTSPHYVRCLKPNDDLLPNDFNALVIADQLNCAGVLEAIRVSRIGFPHRYTHERFVQRYRLVSPVVQAPEPTAPSPYGYGRRQPVVERAQSDSCDLLIERLTPLVQELLKETPEQNGIFLGMQMGRTKVFLRRPAFEALEYLRGRKLEDSATKIQAMARMYICRIDFEVARYAAIVIQKFVRQIEAFRLVQEYRIDNSILRIQRAWRCYVARKIRWAGLYIAWWCQSSYRGSVARQYCAYIFLDNKVSILQRAWKRYSSKRTFRKIRSAVITVQNRYRCRVAVRQLYRLRREARDLGSVAAERDKFREETKRLRQELEVAKQVTPPANKDEVAKLRSELAILRDQLEHTRRTASQDNEADIQRLLGELARREDELEFLRHEIVSLRSQTDSFSIKSLTIENNSTVSRGQISPLPVAKMSLAGKSPVRADVSLLDEAEEVVIAAAASVAGSGVGSAGGSTSFAEKIQAAVPPPPEALSHTTPSFPQPDGEELRYLHSSIRQGNRKFFEQILRQANDPCVLVNQGDQYGRTAMHLAAISQNTIMAETLLEHGAAANAQDLDGETPLHLAENAAMTELLLTKGKANPNIPNVDGICALHLAVQRRDVGSVQVLLRNNANVNNADNIRWFTALHLIALPARTEVDTSAEPEVAPRIAQFLTGPYGKHEPDLDYQDREGNSPLHYAVQLEAEEACGVICVFLEKGADPNIRNERNQSPLHLLCHNELLRNSDVFHEILHAILFHNGDPNLQSLTGCTPLHLSLYHKDIDSAVQLVSGGAELHLLWKKVRLTIFEVCVSVVIFPF